MTRRSDTPGTDAMTGGQDALSGRLGSNESGQYSGIERRVNPHREDEHPDWETIALRRIARRVELMPNRNATPQASADHGWEEAAVNALRRRLGELKSD